MCIVPISKCTYTFSSVQDYRPCGRMQRPQGEPWVYGTTAPCPLHVHVLRVVHVHVRENRRTWSDLCVRPVLENTIEASERATGSPTGHRSKAGAIDRVSPPAAAFSPSWTASGPRATARTRGASVSVSTSRASWQGLREWRWCRVRGRETRGRQSEAPTCPPSASASAAMACAYEHVKRAARTTVRARGQGEKCWGGKAHERPVAHSGTAPIIGSRVRGRRGGDDGSSREAGASASRAASEAETRMVLPPMPAGAYCRLC